MPEIAPPANIVGSQECFAGGALYPQGLPLVGDFVGGFPKRCWGPFQPIPVLTAGDININDRAVQYAMAQVMEAMYDDVVAAAALLQTFLDRPAIISTHSSAGTVYPGIILARTDAYNVVIVAGVQNELQRALTALFSVLPPQDVGGFSTNSYFNLVANFLASFLFANGMDPTLPTLFVGHSLGGAVVTITAARMKVANPNTDIRLLTMGTPRPGDSRLRTAIGNLPSVNIVNVGDYVAQLPPVLRDFYPLAAEVLPMFGLSWVQWTDSANRLAVGIDGRTAPPSALAISWDDLNTAVNAALEGGPFPPVAAHSIAEYRRRLGLPP